MHRGSEILFEQYIFGGKNTKEKSTKSHSLKNKYNIKQKLQLWRKENMALHVLHSLQTTIDGALRSRDTIQYKVPEIGSRGAPCEVVHGRSGSAPGFI